MRPTSAAPRLGTASGLSPAEGRNVGRSTQRKRNGRLW
jgi:hypothetical protein